MGSFPSGFHHDYSDAPLTAAVKPVRLWPWFAAGISTPLIAVALILVSTGSETASVPEIDSLSQAADPAVFASIPRNGYAVTEPGIVDRDLSGNTVRMIVGQGDSLGRMFRQHDLSLRDLNAMVKLPDAGYYLRMLSPGNEIVVTHEMGQVQSLEREIDDFSSLRIVRTSDSFSAALIDRPVETRAAGAHGVIERSLFAAAQDAGIADPLIMKMAEIFQWDIDFLKDVRSGDEFTVIYEELWSDGEKLKDGEILAAEYINRGTAYRAARYVDEHGAIDYYTPEGRSVRKAFIRAPVDFTRISSAFDLGRRHPVLNTIRAHRGVDYAAPSGTPVRAAGDGTVSFRGARNGFGNTVTVEHGGKITTLYAHLSRFADIRVGSRVQQGQTIGYVGMTGLATGPHLHYEYQVNGVHRNPETATMHSSEPVYLADADLDAFQTTVASLWVQLDLHRPTQFRATKTY